MGMEKRMRYAVVVHKDEGSCYGVTIPDFPGCFTAGDTLDEAIANVQEAVECHCQGEDMAIPDPAPLETLMSDPDYKDGVWVIVDIDLSRIMTRAKRVNITLPENLLRRIDEYAGAHGMNRSAFLARAAGEFMEERSA